MTFLNILSYDFITDLLWHDYDYTEDCVYCNFHTFLYYEFLYYGFLMIFFKIAFRIT